MQILLDTNAVIFFSENSARLSGEAYRAIVDPESEIYVSAITSAELSCLHERKKVVFPEHPKIWFRRVLKENGWSCLPVSLDIVEESYSLPEPIHRDPADRIIIATARLGGMQIIRSDDLILKYPHVRSMA
jgi:PIN domain nuclease of toxin-antitoxin system